MVALGDPVDHLVDVSMAFLSFDREADDAQGREGCLRGPQLVGVSVASGSLRLYQLVLIRAWWKIVVHMMSQSLVIV
jgi:hypothetical protein